MRVGILLPRAHVAGGVKRAALMITELLVNGATQAGDEIDVVLGINGDPDSFLDDQRPLAAPGVSARGIRFRRVSEEQARSLVGVQGGSLPDDGDRGDWAVVLDESTGMLDCDVWLQLTTRVGGEDELLPIVPLRPVILIPFDFLEAYGFALASDDAWRGSRRVARSASRVLVSTAETGRDAIAYMGCHPHRVVLTPVEFFTESHKCAQGSEPDSDMSSRSYCIWVTNSSAHKNARRMLKALERVARTAPDFRCLVVGYGTQSLGSDVRVPLDRVSLLGYVGDEDYCRLLAGSRFLVHGATHDNGSYAPLDAALHGVATVSSDYPAMREVAASLGLQCDWFDPLSIDDIERALEQAWLSAGVRALQRPVLSHCDLDVVSRRWYSRVGPILRELVDA